MGNDRHVMTTSVGYSKGAKDIHGLRWWRKINCFPKVGHLCRSGGTKMGFGIGSRYKPAEHNRHTIRKRNERYFQILCNLRQERE